MLTRSGNRRRGRKIVRSIKCWCCWVERREILQILSGLTMFQVAADAMRELRLSVRGLRVNRSVSPKERGSEAAEGFLCVVLSAVAWGH
jgi:hypothetical protein